MASCHSVYLQAFTELYPDLIGNLKSGVFDITDQAYSKFLISIDVKDEITSRTSGKTETERTRILLDAIQAKISESDVYYQFLEILQEDKAFNEVACKFEAKVQAQEEQKGEFYSTKGMPVFLYILSPVISYNCRTYNGNYFVWPFGDLHASAA